MAVMSILLKVGTHLLRDCQGLQGTCFDSESPRGVEGKVTMLF